MYVCMYMRSTECVAHTHAALCVHLSLEYYCVRSTEYMPIAWTAAGLGSAHVVYAQYVYVRSILRTHTYCIHTHTHTLSHMRTLTMQGRGLTNLHDGTALLAGCCTAAAGLPVWLPRCLAAAATGGREGEGRGRPKPCSTCYRTWAVDGPWILHAGGERTHTRARGGVSAPAERSCACSPSPGAWPIPFIVAGP